MARSELLAIRKRLTAARRREIINQKRKTMATVKPKMTLAAAAWMAMLRKTLQAGVRAGLRGASAETIAGNLTDWTKLEAQGRRILLPGIDLAHRAGRDLAAPRIKKYKAKLAKAGGGTGASSGPYVPLTGAQPKAAYAWSIEHTGKLVVEITEATRQGIIGFVAPRLLDGKSNQQIARDLRTNNVVGLWSKQVAAVGNYWSRLVDGGMSESDADDRAGRYADRLLAYRTDMIARTETSFALNEGIRSTYKENDIKYLERVEDPVGDPKWDCSCRENNGKIYTVDEAEGVLPEHPNCEGTWVYAEGPGEGDTAIPEKPGAEEPAVEELVPPPEEPAAGGPKTYEEMMDEASTRLNFNLEGMGPTGDEIENLLTKLGVVYQDVTLGGVVSDKGIMSLDGLTAAEQTHLAKYLREGGTWGSYFPQGNVRITAGGTTKIITFDNPVIGLNTKIGTKSGELAVAHAKTTGWQLTGDVAGIARHEFGHAIDSSVQRYGISSSPAFHKQIDKLVDEYGARNVIGGYAASKSGQSYYSEALAELSDRHLGNKYPNIGKTLANGKPTAAATMELKIKTYMDKILDKYKYREGGD